ncbi:PBP1A family penicillin-binding protein [Desulfosporosinus sp. OT]|uniref:transglycosylase domain-containing protein n=1 Tax=Desulfosporosinus sp. OT TaxID=913865 RepID=UPI0002239D5C|nr:PBP1A family penicillin-binding protein [Desulfosporosinus sp. OT]EGW37337.1 penicillin-binding, 1A family protein [Desulfosporosinus sp. OT]
MPSSRRPTSPRRKKRSSKPRIILLSIVTFIVLVMIGLVIFVGIAATGTPKWDPSLLHDQKQTSFLYDKDNVQYASLHGVENRQTVISSKIPDLVKKTFVAVEDKRFYQHFGVDPIRIIGSALNDIRSRSTKEGASTITIQLARNAFIDNPTAKTFTRKIQEAILAIQLEHEYTKDEILTFYLNKIFLGESSFGIQAAARTYFGKDIGNLTPDQVALLAGLPQAPSQYNPYMHPDAAKNRRTIVLGVMRDAGIITAQEYTTYKDTPFDYVDTMKKTLGGAEKTTVSDASYKYPYFVDYVIEELESTYNLTPDQIFSGGLKIYTTVNPKVQGAAEAAFADPANFPKGIDSTKVQGAITVIEPSTGSIQAMVGGRDYTTRGLNRAWQSPRPPGSTIKPLVVYGPAIQKGGYFPGTVLDDMPVSYNQGNGKAWSPTDFDTIDKGWKGLITMRYALEDSVNVYAVKLLDLIGIDYGWKFGKENLGLPLEDSDRNLTLALGTPNISTLQMAAAYGIYANNGVSVTSHAIVKVVDAKGNTVTSKITKNRVMKETTAYIINDMLRSVVTDGTGYSAQIGNWAVAGKTGTTSLDPNIYGNRTGNPDAWFAGYTPNYAGVVWMGYDSDPDRQHYLRSVYGGSYPAQIWKKVMTAALQDLPVQSKFTIPPGIISGSYDTKSGLLPSSLTPSTFISTEIAAQGDFPTRVSDVWFEKQVDADHPNLLANPNSTNTVTKIFLNLPSRDPSWIWPQREAPYKPPTETVSDPVTTPPASDPVTGLDPTIPPPTSGLPEIDPTLPSPTLGRINYTAKTYTAVIPMTVPEENMGDSTIFYLQRTGQTTIESFPIAASNSASTSISISLGENGKPPIPGDYIFWAAFKNRNGSGIGPLSGSVKLTLTD